MRRIILFNACWLLYVGLINFAFGGGSLSSPKPATVCIPPKNDAALLVEEIEAKSRQNESRQNKTWPADCNNEEERNAIYKKLLDKMRKVKGLFSSRCKAKSFLSPRQGKRCLDSLNASFAEMLPTAQEESDLMSEATQKKIGKISEFLLALGRAEFIAKKDKLGKRTAVTFDLLTKSAEKMGDFFKSCFFDERQFSELQKKRLVVENLKKRKEEIDQKRNDTVTDEQKIYRNKGNCCVYFVKKGCPFPKEQMHCPVLYLRNDKKFISYDYDEAARGLKRYPIDDEDGALSQTANTLQCASASQPTILKKPACDLIRERNGRTNTSKWQDLLDQSDKLQPEIEKYSTELDELIEKEDVFGKIAGLLGKLDINASWCLKSRVDVEGELRKDPDYFYYQYAKDFARNMGNTVGLEEAEMVGDDSKEGVEKMFEDVDGNFKRLSGLKNGIQSDLPESENCSRKKNTCDILKGVCNRSDPDLNKNMSKKKAAAICLNKFNLMEKKLGESCASVPPDNVNVTLCKERFYLAFTQTACTDAVVHVSKDILENQFGALSMQQIPNTGRRFQLDFSGKTIKLKSEYLFSEIDNDHPLEKSRRHYSTSTFFDIGLESENNRFWHVKETLPPK
ncbi:MAG: hypothetical protein HQK53_13670 [Oligoflexia bacterium]|nr:hypothetical protein [Oligoflexia bacterium]